MNSQEQPTVTVPGYSLSMRVKMQPAPKSQSESTTTMQTVTEFQAIEHLLSKIPLRRPNRTRPIDD